MIFDTDVFIWIRRGNAKAARIINETPDRFLSILTYMELIQGTRVKAEHRRISDFLKKLGFQTLPLSENIGYRAAVYVEEFSPSHGLQAGDAIIAATAAEHSLVLCTGNVRHFKAIREIRIKAFRPD